MVRMLEVTRLLARRLSLPTVAIAVGGLMSSSYALVQDHACARFEGQMGGNDPCALATLDVCRDGDRLWGLLRSEGQSGVSVSELSGEMGLLGSARLRTIDVVMNEPNPGWTFCFDDQLAFQLEPMSRQLLGQYSSVACADEGEIRLRER